MSKFSILLIALLMAGVAAAEPITLCSTGMTANCVSMGIYLLGATDPNYTLIAVPSSSGLTVPGPTYLTQNNTFPIPLWIANDASSAWITPTRNQGVDLQGTQTGEYYIYETTFTLGQGFLLPQIHGWWATDNSGIDILLNGHSIGSTIAYGSGAPGDPYGFDHPTNFDIINPAYFTSGVNTLDFVVANGSETDITGPSGLRVQINSADYVAPEPATFGLLLLGLPAAFFLNRKRA